MGKHTTPADAGTRPRNNAARSSRRVPEETNARPLSKEEIERVLSGGANPGLRPFEEAIEPLPPGVGRIDGQIATYAIMRIDQLSLNFNKMQREICWAHQRISKAGIPREPYQYNGGARPTDTTPMGNEVANWPDQNRNPFRRHAPRNVGRPPTGNTSSSSASVNAASEENTEEGERNVF